MRSINYMSGVERIVIEIYVRKGEKFKRVRRLARTRDTARVVSLVLASLLALS